MAPALLSSLTACSLATPLLPVLAQGAVGALAQLRGWRQLSTAPAKAVTTQSAADGPTASDIKRAAAAAKCRSKPRQQHIRITMAPLGVQSMDGALHAALHTYAAALIRQSLSHEEVARAAMQTLQDVYPIDCQLGKNPSCRTCPLGNYPELWDVHYSKLRQAILDHPNLLADCGIRPEDFKPEGKRSSWHLDHIIPQSRGGPDHALNLVIMEDTRNYYFGADLTAEKAQEVGPQIMLDATEFYVRFHKAALGPGVYQELLQRLQPFGSLRVGAVLPLAGRMISSQQPLMRA